MSRKNCKWAGGCIGLLLLAAVWSGAFPPIPHSNSNYKLPYRVATFALTARDSVNTNSLRAKMAHIDTAKLERVEADSGIFQRVHVDTGLLARVEADSGIFGGTRGIAYADLSGRPLTISMAQATKLAGIEAQAQKNPPRVRKFAVTDANIKGTWGAGEWGLYNGNSQVQATSISAVDTIYFALKAATFGHDATDPATDLQAQDLHAFFGDAVRNGGAILIAARQGAQIAYVQAETIGEVRVDNVLRAWKLYNLTWENGFAAYSEGVNWQLVVGYSYGFFLRDGLGLLPWAKLSGVPDFVTDEELRGRESDRYASYTNAFIAATYRRGLISLFTQASGPPVDAHAVRQPDIADRATDGIVAFSTFLRTDRDPNRLEWAPESAATDYTSGQELYVSVWNYPGAHVKVTLTSNGTLVSSGDAAYIWATATWDEVNQIPDVIDYGNYFKVAEYQPSDLQVRLPATDILDPPWLRVDGTNVSQKTKDAIQGDNESVQLTQRFRVDTTDPAVSAYYIQRIVASKQLIIRLPSQAAGTQTDLDLQRLLQPAAWVQVGPWFGDITTNANRAVVGQSLTFSFNYLALMGTYPTGATPVALTVIGEDVHRGQLVRPTFVAETPNVAGAGGAAGQIWTRGASATDADWALNYLVASATAPAHRVGQQWYRTGGSKDTLRVSDGASWFDVWIEP